MVALVALVVSAEPAELVARVAQAVLAGRRAQVAPAAAEVSATMLLVKMLLVTMRAVIAAAAAPEREAFVLPALIDRAPVWDRVASAEGETG